MHRPSVRPRPSVHVWRAKLERATTSSAFQCDCGGFAKVQLPPAEGRLNAAAAAFSVYFYL